MKIHFAIEIEREKHDENRKKHDDENRKKHDGENRKNMTKTGSYISIVEPKYTVEILCRLIFSRVYPIIF
jgi:hypothetical protein